MSTYEESLKNKMKNYKWDESKTSLRRWHISEFKSVKNSTEVELAPLTVVVGANSAGKSSLIQSILLVAQNASGGLRSTAAQGRGIFELNGFLVQLGSFNEVACDLGMANPLKRSFGLGGLWHLGSNREPTNGQRQKIEIPTLVEDESLLGFSISEVQLEWGIKFSAKGKDLESGVVPISSSYAITIQDGMHHQIAKAKRAIANSALKILRGKFDKFSFSHTAYVVPHGDLIGLSEVSEDQLVDSNYKEKLNHAVHFRSGLPVSGLQSVGIADYIFNHQKSVLLDEVEEFLWPPEFRPGPPDKNGEPTFPYKEKVAKDAPNPEEYGTFTDAQNAFIQAVARIAKQILQQDQVGDDLNILKFARLVERKPLVPIASIPFDPQKLYEEAEKEVDQFIESARILFDETFLHSDWVHAKILCSIDGRRRIQPVIGRSKTSSTVELWNRYLAESVVYLGPLRASPKSTYGLGSGIENMNIPLGESGEFTAKKLFSEKNLKRYHVPENGRVVGKRITLEEAVSLWYQELCITPDLSDNIGVQAPGRQGYLLNIGSRTLANVGFGVSQILPVITLCLIMQPGDLILLEQPELHLNPGMQQKLADFLLEMVKTGRQIIVETHSEYLITRLRRRAATNENDHKYFGIIFAERDEKEGTSYRSVNVNDQGDLSEWPKGFFDHVADDLRVLMRKAAERQANQANSSLNKDFTKGE